MKKIIWSVDAFQQDKSILLKTIEFLVALQKKANYTIEPVYILSDGLLGLSIPRQSLKNIFLKSAQENLKKLTELAKKNGLKNIEPPKIFTLILSSQKEAVEVLTTHAKKEKADFIVVSSHAKKGLKRLIIGSFAETLTNYAKYPVAVITPNMQIKNDFSSIVLPTTFTKNEKKVFLWAIQFAKNFKSKIIITHSLPYPQDPILSSGMFLLGSAPSVPIVNLTDYEKSKKEIEKKAKDLEKLAKLHQIKTETIINDMCITISDGIIKTSKKQKASLIIMAHQSSRLATTLLGSITRQIIRESSTPVLIYKT